ncbi:hypothetical protein JCM10213_001199 [Rhodosporidiobolus nylandii]
MAAPLPLPAHTPAAAHPHHALTVPSLLPSPSAPPPKRADVVALKLRLAALLPPHKGEAYWSALGEFMLGRITRGELEEVMATAFGRRRAEAVKLHNALLLSILYNTTRPYLPPSSVRHSGFTPRGAKKRGLLGAGDDADAASQKRAKLLKSAVMALGRRERGDLKALSLPGSAAAGEGKKKKGQAQETPEEESARKARRLGRISEAIGGTSYGGIGKLGPEGVPRGLEAREGGGAGAGAALAQEYRRLAQTPLCCESRMLPDSETLRDRMLLLAYEDELVEGVESRATGLMHAAIEQHLTSMIASVISLVRGTRQAVPQPRSAAPSTVSTPVPSTSSTFAPAGSAPPAPSAASPAHFPSLDGPSVADDEEATERPPLTIGDFHALFAISPSLLGPSPHSAAVERMYAIPPPDSDSSDEYDTEEEEAHEQARSAAQQKALKEREDAEGDTKMLDAQPPNAAAKPQHPAVSALSGSAASSSSAGAGTGLGAGKKPRLSRSRNSSFYGGVRPVLPPLPSSSSHPTDTADAAAAAKARFVLDPSSLHGVPEGHPDVPHLVSAPIPPLPPSLAPAPSANGTAAAGALSASTPAGGLSPKSLSLRNALFPELASAGSSSAAATPGAAPPSASASASAATAAGGAGEGNGTTDAGESDSEAEPSAASAGAGGAKAGLKIKLGSSVAGAASQPAQPPRQTTNERDREAGRKLWEVVDSVKLLDGVLPP